jgi:hypothetical protein
MFGLLVPIDGGFAHTLLSAALLVQQPCCIAQLSMGKATSW